MAPRRRRATGATLRHCDPKVVEGQLYVRSMEKTRRGNFRWPCKCGKDMSEWIRVIKRLDSGENVQDGFSFKI